MKEQIEITILPADKKLPKKSFTIYLNDFWELIWKESGEENPFITFVKSIPADNTDKTLIMYDHNDKLACLTKEDRLCETRKTDRWKNYHTDFLRLSNKFKTVLVFEVKVHHPQSGKKFKVFYHNVKTRITDDMNEVFDKALLI